MKSKAITLMILTYPLVIKLMMKSKPLSIWFNGLSGSGKTTLALALKDKLAAKRIDVKLLDGDIIRRGINKDLGFSKADRIENLRRVAEINRLFIQENFTVLNAFITPDSDMRFKIASIIPNDQLFEISLVTPLETCIQRDVKDLYKLAKVGAIQNFTGIHKEFEPSTTANLKIDTSEISISDCCDLIIEKLDFMYPKSG